jgi:hypothetical protein
MKKLVWVLFAFAGLMIACTNSQKNTGDKASQEGPVTLTVNEFLTDAGSYVGQEIKIQGTVSHACKHGGKRMFIFDDNEDNRVKIEAGNSVSSFDASLEGSDVLVTGILKELIIDEAFLAEWEMEVTEEMNHPEEDIDTTLVAEHESGGLGEAADQGKHVSALESIAEYRKQIQESGKDHLSFYSVECTSYEVLPEGSNN